MIKRHKVLLIFDQSFDGIFASDQKLRAVIAIPSLFHQSAYGKEFTLICCFMFRAKELDV